SSSPAAATTSARRTAPATGHWPSSTSTPPARRLTLSLPVLCQARYRAVLCLGAPKAWTLQAWRRGADRSCPASLLPRDGTDWFLDDDAVRALA
ncbi:MAG: 6-phosphogluconolactonase, partial [Planctomycetes bacterium]|nr:6-phosphogluconolactonase [Planctomycetota bacterium]